MSSHNAYSENIQKMKEEDPYFDEGNEKEYRDETTDFIVAKKKQQIVERHLDIFRDKWRKHPLIDQIISHDHSKSFIDQFGNHHSGFGASGPVRREGYRGLEAEDVGLENEYNNSHRSFGAQNGNGGFGEGSQKSGGCYGGLGQGRSLL